MDDQNSETHPLFPKPLLISKIVAPLKYKRDIIRAAEEIGEVEPIEVDPRTGVDEIQVEERRNQMEAYRTKLNSFLDNLDKDLIIKDASIQVGKTEEDVLKHVNSVVEDKGSLVDSIISRKQFIRDRINELNSILDLLNKFNTLNIEATSILRDSSHVKTFLGTIFPTQLNRLYWEIDEITERKYLIIEETMTKEDTIVLLSVLQSDAEAVETKLKTLNFTDISIPQDADWEGLTAADCKKELADLEIERQELDIELDEIAADVGFEFVAALEIVNLELKRVEVERKMKRTETTCVMWAWIPDEIRDEFVTKMHVATNGTGDVDFRKGDFDPDFSPSYVENSEFMEPMRGLVSAFGTPGMHEIDPYKFVSFFFPVLFGIMFADVGHGFILFLIGIIAYWKKKKMDEIPSGLSGYVYGGAELLIIMGATAMVIGVPMNSFFGDETILWQVPIFKTLFEHNTWAFFFDTHPPEGLETHATEAETDLLIERNYVNFLIFSFVMGVIVILTGLILNLYQLYFYRHSEADWQAGLTLFGTYFFGIVAVILYLIAGTIPAAIGGIIMVGCLFGTIIIEARAHGIDGAMLAFDHLLSLMSNTLSFGRLLAMNTIHFTLAFLPYLFAELFFDVHVLNHSVLHWEVNLIVWIICAIIGTIIVVPVETTFSTLQSLRLNWVEFFGKFYDGNGVPFNPIEAKRIHTVEV